MVDLNPTIWAFTLNVINLSESMKVKSLSHVQLFVTLWTVAYQAPPSMGFSRQGYWSGLPFPSPGRFFLLSLMGKCLASRQLNHVNFLPFLSWKEKVSGYFTCLQSFPTTAFGNLVPKMATHSSILAWRIPWTEEPGGLQSTGSQRVRHDWATKHKNIHQNEELKMHYKFKIQIFI